MTAVKSNDAATSNENVYTALCAAQAAMGPVYKGAENPHFRSKYADLSDVMQVAIPALAEQGVAVYHAIEGDPQGTLLMTTVLVHGLSNTRISCQVPMILPKKDMQGMKSAATYAKRIGIESLTGIAPEDDDGNSASRRKMSASAAKRDHWPQFERALLKCEDRDQLAEVWQELRDDADRLPEKYVAACNDALQSHAAHIGIPMRVAAE